MSGELIRLFRSDGTEHIIARPEPAIFDVHAEMSKAEAFGGDPRAHVLGAVRLLKDRGIKVDLTPEGRDRLRAACPEALALLEG